jgi:uncharacterized membrane protein
MSFRESLNDVFALLIWFLFGAGILGGAGAAAGSWVASCIYAAFGSVGGALLSVLCGVSLGSIVGGIASCALRLRCELFVRVARRL